MTKQTLLSIATLLLIQLFTYSTAGAVRVGIQPKPHVIFATYAESDEQLRHVCILAESLWKFGRKYADSPVWVYLSTEYTDRDTNLISRIKDSGVKIYETEIPDEASWFYYAGKVFAAGEAEKSAEKIGSPLVWLDEDTIILNEPTDLILKEGVSFAYRPVMHNRSGSLYSEPPDEFWGRIYDVLELDPDSLYPMTTPADKQEIRSYFNAGLLAVRPEVGILRGWGDEFLKLCSDSVLSQMCRDDVIKRIFLHQTALVAPPIKKLKRDEMVELSLNYNYPMFFKRQFGALEEFDDIGDVITLRYDTYFRNPDPDWSNQLTGPGDKISFLREKLGEE